MTDFVVCFATALEGDGLPSLIGGRSLALLRTGVGPVNAAFALTALLLRQPTRAVIVCGVGGAYPGSGLEPGDVVCAESETYGDLGADSPAGFLDMEALGFPVIDGNPPLFNRLPLDLFPVARRAPFVTCATCTGTDEQAVAMAARTGGAVESMEGAAIVHVARLLGVRVGRGPRNLERGRRPRPRALADARRRPTPRGRRWWRGSRRADADARHLAVSQRHVRLLRDGRRLPPRARRCGGAEPAGRAGRVRRDQDLGRGLRSIPRALRAAARGRRRGVRRRPAARRGSAARAGRSHRRPWRADHGRPAAPAAGRLRDRADALRSDRGRGARAERSTAAC